MTLGGHAASEDSTSRYVGYGRYGLYKLLRACNFCPGDKVLLPAYICNVVLLPLAALGIEPVYYAVDDGFRIDWNSIRIQPRTRAIISVNYFGFPADFLALENFAREHGLLWINDNAHGFASCQGDTPLENYGDVSITCFRKVIPAPNGARVRFNKLLYEDIPGKFDQISNSMDGESSLYYILGQIAKNYLFCWRKPPDYSIMNSCIDIDSKQFQINQLSLRSLTLFDEEEIRQRRRHVYSVIYKYFENQEIPWIKIPILLNDGNSPFVFPVEVLERSRWQAILERSRNLMVDIHTWPSLQKEVIENNIFNAYDLWKKYIFLPIHQNINIDNYHKKLSKVFNGI